MNLIVGSTGMVGSEICRLLRAEGKPVRALVRSTSDPAKVDQLKSLGAQIVLGDLRDRASLEAACQKVISIITTASSMPFKYQPGLNTPKTTDQDGILNLISAAQDAGVQRFVFISFPPAVASFPLEDAKRRVEHRLRESGLNYTILQPTFFSEVWLHPGTGFDYPNRKATIYGTSENPISWISYLDVARFAAASLDHPAARNVTWQLGGPQNLSPLEVVRIFESAASKPFEVVRVPVEALQAQFAAASDEMQKSFTGLMLTYANGVTIDMKDLMKLFQFELKSVAEYARNVIA